ncbi:hypothetical protein DERP_003735 [Dermatophagoides pteronyssinus]|uniref:Uncharacterized protein n=1 Tax=Dermatophagoides pteronyssinus TaxID=6956 RepID=A0ABQ8JLH0_DERPT|nr:hypothetical protein DERP_003735 [Dermatophagoides pteronyssinus]
MLMFVSCRRTITASLTLPCFYSLGIFYLTTTKKFSENETQNVWCGYHDDGNPSILQLGKMASQIQFFNFDSGHFLGNKISRKFPE